MMAGFKSQGLFTHIENGDVQVVRQLLHGDIINLDERNELGETFLMVASRHGHAEIVEELLKHADTIVDARDNDNWTALLNAAKEGHAGIVMELLDHGANIEHADLGGWTAIMWAAYKGRTMVVEVLLEREANPNVKGDHHMSPLLWAAGRGHLDIVVLLLDTGAKVNSADKNGTTPLVWAARKGYIDIVKLLLSRDANVDKAGMNSWTALFVAAKGGYTDVVEALLQKNPNINAADKDGFTALGIAAKDGHLDIVHALLLKNVYVNLEDRYGDTFLIHAVKAGHEEVAQALLDKMSDVDHTGVDNKTALYWAVEKGYTNITSLLLRYNPDTEKATKDGDTPLMKAVRGRNTSIIEALMQKGAKLSATDKHGDNCLHMAIRGKSRKVLELLLRNPANKRLLYRPNARGETAYQLDMASQRGIINAIYGRGNLNAEEIPQGYEMYSSTIADVLSDPQLHTPMTLGLYAKWGSGKSVLINRLIEQMKTFTQANAEPSLQFSWLLLLLSLVLCVIVGCIVGLATKLWYSGLAVGLGLMLIVGVTLAIMWFSSHTKRWHWSSNMARYLARKYQNFKLFLQIMFCNRPQKKSKVTGVVRFLFTDNARLASVVGEKSIASMISTLSEALETEYGMLATRLYKVFKPGHAVDRGRFKSICCLPTFVITILVFLCILTAITLLLIFPIKSITVQKNKAVASTLIALGAIVALVIAANILTWGRAVLGLFQPQKKRVQRISGQLESLRMEGYMQELKKEVELMADMSLCMDAFLNTDTRLVAIVDGLDSCEQERLLQVLDTVHMLFGENYAPFITILAVDPQVIIRGIEQNISRPLFSDSSINGYDYLRNLVHLPFFIQSQALPMPRNRPKEEIDGPDTSNKTLSTPSTARNKLFQSQDSNMQSSNDISKPRHSKAQVGNSTVGTTTSNIVYSKQFSSQHDLSKSIFKTTYYSDVNPRNMRRLMHIVAVTGRLLKACHIDFSWHRLGAWINITEQWPYRLSWIIQYVEENEGVLDSLTLKNIYEEVAQNLPLSKDYDRYLEIDRNARRLETFLANYSPPLSVVDLRRFMPCTINLDPYLRKLIKELQELPPVGPQEQMSMLMSQMYPGAPSQDSAPSTTSLRHRRFTGNRENLTSPRGTPARPDSRAPMLIPPHAYPWFPGMVPHPSGMMPHPASFVNMNQLSNTDVGYYGQGLNMANNGGTPQPSNTQANVSPRISLEVMDLPKPLAGMDVEDVCALLTKIEGLHKNKIPIYQERVGENNITGAVLAHCDLSELKPVMGMSFGDWELFRTTIKALREAREYNRQQEMSFVDGPVPQGGVIRTASRSKLEEQLSPKPLIPEAKPFACDENIQSPTPKKPSDSMTSSQMAAQLSDLLNEVSNQVDGNSGENEEYEMTPMDHEVSGHTSQASVTSKESSKEEKSGFRYGAGKPDNELCELMQEQDMFDSVMEEMGMGSDDESETEEPTLNETDNDSIVMNSLEDSHDKKVQGSTDTFDSQAAGGSKEPDSAIRPRTLSNLSNVSRGSRGSRSSGIAVIRIEHAEDIGSPLLAQSNDDMKKSKGSVNKLVNAMKQLVPSPISSGLKKFKSREKGLNVQPDILASTSSSREDPEEGNGQDRDTVPLMTAATSREHLNVRKSMPVSDISGPSAFKVVTTGSSFQPGTEGRAQSCERSTLAVSSPTQQLSSSMPSQMNRRSPAASHTGSKQLVVDADGNSSVEKDGDRIQNI